MRKRSFFRAGFVGLMMSFGLLYLSAIGQPVFAQTTTQTTALNSPAGAATSLNWAGYAATGGSFTTVSGSWVVPVSAAAPNTSLSADATWVGIGGVTSRDLIQAGTQTVFQSANARSSAAAAPAPAPIYEAWYELLPADSVQVPLAVHPGDAMTISVTQQTTGMWLISFTDVSTGQTYATSINYSSVQSSAEWIEEAPSDGRGQVALDNFGTAAFTGGSATINGSPVTIAGANAASMTMVAPLGAGGAGAGQALAAPSALGADGSSFTVTRTNLPASAAIAIGAAGADTGRGIGRWSRTGVSAQGFTRTTHIAISSSSHSAGKFERFFQIFSALGRNAENQKW